MPKALDEIAHDAVELSRHDRLTLARILLDLDTPTASGDVEDIWDAEIRARLAAYDAGSIDTEPYEDVRARMQRRFGR